ncbi:MAG: beta-galactosidase, partial [Actinobacteria bacterium]|nr:beta-galactosidase [Actinomycetota bacterium]
MHEAGIGWVRFDFDWIFLEPSQGSWDFSVYDHAVEKAASYGIQILGLIGSCPAWANGGQNWNFPPSDMAAWRDFVHRVVSRYQGKVSAWEVWNEENIHAFWQPAPDAAAYVELLRNASEEIRRADPAAKIVMGGVAGLDPDYLHACLSAGAAEYVDAIAYHPYPSTLFPGNYTPQEERCRYIVNWLRTWLLPQHDANDLELWITEVGWTTCTFVPPGVSEEDQADYLSRTLINYASMSGLDKFFYYDMWDEAEWAWDPMSNYGLLHYDFSPRDSYRFYQTIEAILGEAVPAADDLFTTTCDTPDSLEAHPFLLGDGRIALAAWKADSMADSLSFTLLDADFAEGAVVDLATGELSPVNGLARDGEGRLAASGLALGKRPVLLVFTPQAHSEDPPPPEEPPGGEEPPPGGDTPGDGQPPAPEDPPAPGEPGDPAQPPTAEPACTDWYFAEGCTAGGFETWILVQNPTGEAVEVTLTFMNAGGEVVGPAATLPPRSRRTFNAGEYVSDYDVSTRVNATGSVICERAVYWDDRKGGHDSLGAISPSATWYLAEGCTAGGFETWVLVQNPGDEAVEVTLTFMTAGGEVVGPTATLPPRSRRTFNAGEYVSDYDVSTQVNATGEVVCERSMYAEGRQEGSNSMGI